MIRMGGLVLGVTLAAVVPSVAETPEERQACMDDAYKFCERAIPDQDRVFSCLVANKSVISPLCQVALAPYLPPEPPAAPKQAGKGKTKTGGKSKTTTTSKGPLNLNPNAR